MPSAPSTDERLAALLARFPDDRDDRGRRSRRDPTARRGTADVRRGPGEPWSEPVDVDPDETELDDADDLDDAEDLDEFDDDPRGGVDASRRGTRGAEDDAGAGGRRRGPGRSPGVVRTPSSLVGATTRPGRWQVIGLVTALLVAAAGVGGWAWLTHAEAEGPAAPTPAVAGPTRTAAEGFGSRTPTSAGARSGPARGGASGTATDGTPGTPGGGGAGASAQVAVHVVGAVRRPGVVHLSGGARVDDAIKAAGGPLPTADLTSVNLARPLVDGEQLVLGIRGEPRPAGVAGAPSTPTRGAGAVPSRGSAGGSEAASGTPVDLNTADAAALDALPGVGPVLAKRIVDWRTQHGRFASVDQLGDVDGVGEKTLARLTPLVRV